MCLSGWLPLWVSDPIMDLKMIITENKHEKNSLLKKIGFYF